MDLDTLSERVLHLEKYGTNEDLRAARHHRSVFVEVKQHRTEIKQLRAQVQRMQPVVDAARDWCETPCALSRAILERRVEQHDAQPSDGEGE